MTSFQKCCVGLGCVRYTTRNLAILPSEMKLFSISFHESAVIKLKPSGPGCQTHQAPNAYGLHMTMKWRPGAESHLFVLPNPWVVCSLPKWKHSALPDKASPSGIWLENSYPSKPNSDILPSINGSDPIVGNMVAWLCLSVPIAFASHSSLWGQGPWDHTLEKNLSSKYFCWTNELIN